VCSNFVGLKGHARGFRVKDEIDVTNEVSIGLDKARWAIMSKVVGVGVGVVFFFRGQGEDGSLALQPFV
jgi:hypothetical protein